MKEDKVPGKKSLKSDRNVIERKGSGYKLGGMFVESFSVRLLSLILP